MAGIRADVSLNVNTANVKRSLDKATNEINKVVGKISGKQVSFNVNGKSFTQPLGRITASANEFTKSLEASNARVIAFGASVGIINGVSDAFRNLVLETIRFLVPYSTLPGIHIRIHNGHFIYIIRTHTYRTCTVLYFTTYKLFTSI